MTSQQRIGRLPLGEAARVRGADREKKSECPLDAVHVVLAASRVRGLRWDTSSTALGCPRARHPLA